MSKLSACCNFRKKCSRPMYFLIKIKSPLRMSRMQIQGRREAERAPGQYFGPGPVCLKVRRGGGTHGLVG